MTPDERAEKFNGETIGPLEVERIASEIRQAVEEALKSDTTMSLFIHERLLKEAKSEALEEAAKLVETYRQEKVGDLTTFYQEDRNLAKQIRALGEKL